MAACSVCYLYLHITEPCALRVMGGCVKEYSIHLGCRGRRRIARHLASSGMDTYSWAADNSSSPCRPWVDVSMDVGSTSDAAGAGGGLAALMLAANPSLTPEQMKAAMIAGVDTIPSMQGQLVSNVRRSA